jgi:hypothetical protein
MILCNSKVFSLPYILRNINLKALISLFDCLSQIKLLRYLYIINFESFVNLEVPHIVQHDSLHSLACNHINPLHPLLLALVGVTPAPVASAHLILVVCVLDY